MGRLDAPTKAALRWAWAAALTRTRADDPGVARVDSLDLLAGVVLADLRGSPARELLEHFGIPLGAVLRRGGTHPPSAETLLMAVERLPVDQLPPIDRTTIFVIEDVLSSTPAEPDGLVSLRELFGALLEHAGQAAPRIIREQLAARGAEPDRVIGAYREYLAGRASYGEFLRERFPHEPTRVELPTYLPDQPQPRAAAPEMLPDLVGIRAEIDAFTYLIASTRLAPPLAVGLFGDWGSGKSYFLRSMQHRIDAVARDAEARDTEAAGQEQPSAEPPFHRHIVQIEFNAWQYVGGDLWASLLEHLFRNLRRSGDDSDTLLDERQQYWLSRLQDARAKQEDAERDRERLLRERADAEQQIAERRRDREQALAELERRRTERPLAGWRPSAELRRQITEAAASAGIDVVGERAEDLVAELRRARDALRGAGTVLAPLRTGGWRYLGAVLLLLVLTPAVALALQAVDLAPLAAVATTVASLLATLAAYIKLAATFVTNATRRLAQVQAELAKEETKHREQLDKQVAEAAHRLGEVQGELDAALSHERSLAAEADEVAAELAATTPRRVLSEFITDRLESEDYRSHLGVPALVRRDLERLSQLVAAHRDNPADDPVPTEYAIDRIVLYIDDLDRCPTDLVIKVLEAVHLLLAFPLFVVVVAVDSRWLASSLREHYAQLGGQDAAAEDYLEKIFQVPFLVRPLDAEVRQQMLRGLLAPSLGGQAVEAAGENGGTTDLLPADLAEFRAVVESFATFGNSTWDPTCLAATSLTITADELLAVEGAADLIGSTPRAVKRYVNIYLLTKSMGVGRGWGLPCNGQLAVLLAIATGLPGLADVLLPALARDGDSPLPLGDAVPTPDPDDPLQPAEEIDTLNRWLSTQPDRTQLDMSGLADWIGIVSRFRFSSRP
ncbi:MAG: P-loop NTPase fold protein [Sciscionella sp.]